MLHSRLGTIITFALKVNSGPKQNDRKGHITPQLVNDKPSCADTLRYLCYLL